MYFLKSKKGVSLKKYWFGIPEKNKDIDSGYIEHISISGKKRHSEEIHILLYLVYLGITPKIKTICCCKDKLMTFYSFFQLS